MLRIGKPRKQRRVEDVEMNGLRKAIEAANQNFVKAFNKGDLETALNVYSNDAIILPPNTDMMKGIKAITTYWKAALEMGVKEAKLETVDAIPMGNETAYEIGRYTLKIQPKNGQEFTDKGKYLMVWKLENGLWKWNIDAWNSSLPT